MGESIERAGQVSGIPLDALAIDAAAVAARIAQVLREQVLGKLRRKGVVVGLSGGVDSSVVTALAVRAFGPGGVLALLLPEQDSSSDALRLGHAVAASLQVPVLVENLTPLLEGARCYARAREAINTLFPEYGPGWKHKITLPGILESDRLNVMELTVEDPAGRQSSGRLSSEAFLQLVAATNFKQRSRAMMEYYHADRLHYAVAGTPNRLEYDQGFFVKQGDGAADVKPIAHLYKTQVYALARYLGLPAEVMSRPPTTDTYSIAQTQEEFFFALPYDKMDLCLWARDHAVAARDAAIAVGATPAQVERIYRDIDSKRRAARYLHAAPLLIPEA